MIRPFRHILLRTPLQSIRDAFRIPSVLPPLFDEGLYLSSAAYWQELQKREQLPLKEQEKLDLSLLKYWIRSCSRPTPYGTFAGSICTPVTTAATHIVLERNDRHHRHIRVDMNYLSNIIAMLHQSPQLYNQCTFYTNNSLYEVPGGYRYAEYSTSAGNRKYQLSFVEGNEYLDEIIRAARNGATMNELTNRLAASAEVSEPEARAFLLELWQSQLLISALEPCVTGKDALAQLTDTIGAMEGTEALHQLLAQLQALLAGPEPGIDQYRQAEALLQAIAPGTPLLKNTLQADLYLRAQQNTINTDLVNAITTQVNDLMYLAKKGEHAALEHFKKQFYLQYETQEVPLNIALDADLGIGYAGMSDETSGGNVFTDLLAVTEPAAYHNAPSFDRIQQLAQRKYHDYLQQGLTHIELSEEDLKPFRQQHAAWHFASSMYITGHLMRQAGHPDEQAFLFDLTGISGPSAANLTGRFTHGSKELLDVTRDLLLHEEQACPDVLFAEIVHLPQTRAGNIILRPVLRQFEIPYVGRSGADTDHQITTDDLMISIVNNQIVLRSRQHNKQVLPRLSTAHNYAFDSLPVYKFLCDLQLQQVDFPAVWDWGNISFTRHMPRVSYKNIILVKAQWQISDQEIRTLPAATESHINWFRSFREQRRIPQHVIHVEGEHTLLVDFEEPAAVGLVLHHIRRHKSITLAESLCNTDNCIVSDTDGAPYNNELIIPVYEEQPLAGIVPMPAIAQNITGTRRSFAPNSEWQYFKIYCGTQTAEKILKEYIHPFVEEGLTEGLFERFFFIRYKDDFAHIRIRFYNSDTSRQAALQQAFMNLLHPLIEDGTIHKVVLDTYKRELERYGTGMIASSEILFCNDSLAILRLIQLLDEEHGAHYRFLLALRGIDMLLNDFGLSLEEKRALLKDMQHNYFLEFGSRPVLQKQLNSRYRNYQQEIFSHMNPASDELNEITDAIAAFRQRTVMNGPVVQELLLATREDRGRLYQLLYSYLHMFVNRLFTAQQRKQELVIYHFLEKCYSSQLAILHQQNVPKTAQL